jgi:tetratricopeptide (TPR) repeat protein
MDNATAIELDQPEAALGIFRGLAEQSDFPHRHFAREQSATILWRLGQHEEAEKQYRKLIEEMDQPEAAYARARFVVRLAEIILGPNFTGKVDGKLEQQLEKAEEVFELNADLYMVGKVSQVKAALSTRSGDWDKAEEQSARGRRLTRAYASQGITETSMFSSGMPTFAGSSN